MRTTVAGPGAVRVNARLNVSILINLCTSTLYANVSCKEICAPDRWML